jgi:LysR family transcriptional regulator, benzoate and cis,cis-muconate-responsive activator of ben and cat genes
MDLRALHYFTKVYELGSISGAAKACFIAQPSISASISQLELELNSQLFFRHARGVKASEAGEQLYPLAKKLLNQAEEIKTVFTDTAHKFPVRLGLTKGLGVARMSALLKDFTASIDAMELTLVPPEEPCDARIISLEEKHKDETCRPMWQENYALAIPHNHVLAFKNRIDLTDLKQQPFIQRTTCSAWPRFVDILQQADIDIDVRAKIQTIDYAIGLVSAGLGLALLPLYSETQQYSDISFRPIDKVNLTRNIVLAYHKQSQVTDLLDFLVSKHC